MFRMFEIFLQAADDCFFVSGLGWQLVLPPCCCVCGARPCYFASQASIIRVGYMVEIPGFAGSGMP